MRPVVWSIGEIISIAEALMILICVNFVVKDCLQKRLSYKTLSSFNNSIPIFDINVDSNYKMKYATSLTLGSLVGAGSS